jgi:hypothetical protein
MALLIAPLFTAGIAVGGIQNAYAGAAEFKELWGATNCDQGAFQGTIEFINANLTNCNSIVQNLCTISVPGDGARTWLDENGDDQRQQSESTFGCVLLPKEGCSPGHWKNDADKRDEVDWDDTGFDPTDEWDSIFEPITIRVKDGPGKPTLEGDPTLQQVLNAKGGKINALAREAVAALLNEGHGDIDYPLDQGAIIALVNAALPDDGDSDVEDARATLFAHNHLGEDTLCPLPVPD